MRSTLTSLLLLLSGCQPAFAQTVYWARVIPGESRTVWLYGEDLHKGSEYQGTAKASINGVPLIWDSLIGANGNDANRGLPWLQRFRLPREVAPGEGVLLFERNDGKTAECKVAVYPEVKLHLSPERWMYHDAIHEPIIVKSGETLDLNGCIYLPAYDLKGDSVIVMEAGSRICNGSVLVQEDAAAQVRQCVRLNGGGCIIDGVELTNARRGGYGVYVGSACDCVFYGVSVTADRTWENFPNDWAERNSWLFCRNTGCRGSWDSQFGRGIGGRHNLVAWTQWADMDRGPTASQWGVPLDRSVWFECRQRDTGHSVGASEGLLYESMQAVNTQASVDGVTVKLTMPTATTADLEKRNDRQCRPGMFVCDVDRKTFRRIVSVVTQGQDRVLTLETPLRSGQYEVRVGNLIAENAFIRCSFEDGRSGIWLFGGAARNRVVQCDFSDLREAGIVTMNRKRDGMHAFCWDLLLKDNTVYGGMPLVVERQ